jgi:tetratricopeptide (TPR) repeat protein
MPKNMPWQPPSEASTPFMNPLIQGLSQSLSQGWHLLNPGEQSQDDMTDWLFSDETPDAAIKFQNSLSESKSQLPEFQPVILGPEARLSECKLWQLHEEYYARMGVSAWDGMVPNFITSSAYIAEAYAEMIVAFLQDYYSHLVLDEPVYIVEMATGVGRFSHLLIQELEKKLSLFSRLKLLKIRYIMTDFTESNVNYWRQHEKFQPFVAKGMLDFAVFRPEEETSIHLSVSGQTLSPGMIHNPLIGVANYFFDSIRQDVFQVNSERLFEGLVTLERKITDEQQMNTPVEFSELNVHYRYNELPDANYYDCMHWNGILEEYRREIQPIGGLRVIRNLQTLSNHNLVLLSSDKAYAAVEHMLLEPQHHFAVHGSFSYMVNYDAIGRYFKNSGGRYFSPKSWASSLMTVCCVQTRQPQCMLEHLNYYFDQKMDVPQPITSLTLMLPEEANGLNHLLALMRLTLADPRIVAMLAKQVVDSLPKASVAQRHDLLQIMDMAWQKYFFFRGERNLPYWFAELYYHLNLQEKSLACLDEAMKGYDEYAWEYCFMKGRCYEKLNQWKMAEEHYKQALALNPDYQQAYVALNDLKCLHQF